MYKIATLVFLPALLIGCELPESNNDSEELEHKNINGLWRAPCLGGKSSNEFNIETLEFIDGYYHRNELIFTDSQCDDYIDSKDEVGSYTYETGKILKTSDSGRIMASSDELKITIHNQDTSEIVITTNNTGLVQLNAAGDKEFYYFNLEDDPSGVDPFLINETARYKLLR